jgi:hypothetical protein
MNQTIKTHFSFRCVALFCFLFFMQQASAQNSYIYADKTILAGRGIGNNEFELHNGTRSVLGALVNVGGGVTQFKLVVDTSWALNDSTTRYHRTNGGTYDITIHSSGSGGGITVESDPVATAKTITITGSSDVPVTGGAQTIGANPSFTIGSVNWANGFSVYDARYLTASTQNEVISGGKVTWLHDYVYNVSAATYLIDGVNYSSPSTDITLSAADATDDRIDVFVLTTSNTAIAITGTPSTPAVEPAINANTQLQISFADVNAGSTSPTLNIDWIYQENTEWATATSSPGTVNLSSTNTPYAGSKDIEGTSVANGTTISFTSTVTPTFGNYQDIGFEIKSKANWSTTKKWVLRFFNGTTAIGNPVNFGSSSYGFVSTSTSQYQTITIPLSDFGSISTATKFVITQSNSSGTIGWFLDNVQLQGGGGGGTPSTVALVNDVTGTGTNTIPTTVVAIRNKNIPTLAAGNLKFNGSIWVFDNATYLTGNQSITISGDATGTGTTSIPLTLATVNSSPGAFGSASQSLTGTVNGKGLVTSLSAQNIQITESQVTNLTTDLSGKQASLTGSQGDMIYFSATNALASLAKSTTAHQFISSDGTSNNPLYETINSDWITQGSTNKFYTDALARAAISLTTTGTSGASTYNSSTGVLNIPNYATGGGGSVAGNNTNIQFNNSGAFGGSDNFEWNNSSLLQTINNNADIRTVLTPGLKLSNSIAATSGITVQRSPSLILEGNGWKTASTAASQAVDWSISNLTTSGITAPGSTLDFSISTNGGAYNSKATLSDGAIFSVATVNGTSLVASSSVQTPLVLSGSNGTALALRMGGFVIQNLYGTTGNVLVQAAASAFPSDPGATFTVYQNTSSIGSATNTAGGTTVTGTGTAFLNIFRIGDVITISGESQTITAIASNTSMTTTAWTSAHTSAAYTLTGGQRFNVFGNGQVSINNTTPAASSIVDVASTKFGVLFPRMTNTQRDAISSPAEGLLIYSLTDHAFEYYNGTVWKQVQTL